MLSAQWLQWAAMGCNGHVGMVDMTCTSLPHRILCQTLLTCRPLSASTSDIATTLACVILLFGGLTPAGLDIC